MESVQPNLRHYEVIFLKLTPMVQFTTAPGNLKKKIQKFRKSDNLSKTNPSCY